MGRGNFGGAKRRPIVKYRDTAVIYADVAELIEITFGLLTRMAPTNYVLDGGPDDPMGIGTFCRELYKND